MSRSRVWTLGTAAIIAVVLVAGWFLLVSPTRADAAAVKQQTADQQQANVELAAKIETLKVQSQDLPAQEAKLAKFRQRIPAAPQLPAFIRSLNDIAVSADVELVAIEPQAPQSLTVAVPAAPAATTDDAATPAAPVQVASPVQFVSAQITVHGGYFNTERFFTKLEGLKRSFLVTGFDIASDAGPDDPPGDVTTHVQVRVYFAPLGADTSATTTSKG